MTKTFYDLGVKLSQAVVQTLQELHFQTPTPVQAACIPHLLHNKDVAAQAVTGSGKTLAFLIPIIEILQRHTEPLKKYDIGALIVSPTRELATQTNEVLNKFLARINKISSILIIGGKPISEDVKILQQNGGNIIVATPGRLEELLTHSYPGIDLHRSLKQLEVLVLDEADKLLDFGFEKSLTIILRYIPTQRRTGLFSATQTCQLDALVRAGLRNPQFVVINGNDDQPVDKVNPYGSVSTPQTLTNYYYTCEANEKLMFLVNFIKTKGISLKYMLFLSTCACVDYFATIFKKVLPDILLFDLHGKMKDRRYKIFDAFRECKSGILLCTDVMARGVDIPEVHWVIQYDAPSSAVSFIHRIGRTARIGRIGNSLILLMPNEDAYINFILRNQKVALKELPSLMEASADDADIMQAVRNLQISDRKIFDKANRAFVSYIQSYSKHECNLILRIKDLNFGKLTSGFGLLKLPKMPELKGKKMEDFQPTDIDVNDIKYLNEKQESNRLKNLEEYRSTGFWPTKGRKRKVAKQTTPWAESKQRKIDTREKKMLKKEKKYMKEKEGKIKKKRRKKQKFTKDEIDELARDIALMKKLKHKKISSEDFDNQIGITESS